MNAYYYTLILLLLFSQFIMFTILQGNHVLAKTVKHKFVVLTILLSAVALLEALGVFFNQTGSEWKIAHTIITLTEYCLAPFLAVASVSIVDSGFIFKLSRNIALLHVAVEVIAIFLGKIFYINEANEYVDGPLFFVYYSFVAITLAIYFFGLIRFSKKYQNYNVSTIVAMMVFMTITIAIQGIWADIRVDWLCIGMSNIFFYLYYNDLTLNVDGLTMLLNRSCYETEQKELTVPSTIILFDVDAFKSVNDNYGHMYGG